MATVPKTNNQPKKELEPRTYQLELLEYVTQRNAIIYLPTGAGKTYVAILALKRFSHQLQQSIQDRGKRAIFMCNTIELARQHAVELKKCTNLNIGFYVGERDVDNWSRKKWNEEIVKNQVLVGTAQVFLDIVLQSYIKITDLSLVVIDECHHATKSHPMHEFMRLFQYESKAQLPRVIGLTGVLLKGNKTTNVAGELNNLEATFRGNIITVGSKEEFCNVMVFSTKPHEELIKYAANFNPPALIEVIKNKVNDMCSTIDNWDLGNIPTKLTKNLASIREPNKKNALKNLLLDFVYQMNDFGLYAASIAIMSPIIEIEIKKRQAETLAVRNLYRFVIAKCESISHLISTQLNQSNAVDNDSQTLANILKFSTKKMFSLLTYLKRTFQCKKREDICCLIFVERRYGAKCLFYVIQKYVELTPELKDIIRPQFMVGRNNIAPGIESILDRKWNTSAIESFRTKECNLIICSSVLEEGIDVQACNYVIAFDPLKTFNSYIQTKGRARSANAIYTIFTPDHKAAEVVNQIRKYQELHRVIREYLIGRILDRDDPQEEKIAEQFADTIEPFTIPSGARLLASSALTLLGRYCQTLPTDAFGYVMPWFCKLPIDENGRIQVTLTLPLQSALKETLIGLPMRTAKESKITVAFNACIKLYEQGELNDKLLPITKRECVSKVADELFQHWKKFKDDVTSKTAGRQQRRMYDRMCPEELYNALPQVGEPCFAYEIKMEPLFDENDYNSHIVHMLNKPTNYAILLRKRLPPIAEMPLFMNQGKLNVKIARDPIVCQLNSEEELQLLRRHHLMIFRDLLQMCKNFLVLDSRNKDNSYLLVPLTEGGCINWELVRNFQRLSRTRSYSCSERQTKIYRPEDYVDKVVNKWYSGSEMARFVVTKVRTDLTPLSQFSSDSFDSFKQFVEQRYREQIDHVVQPNQFMLEVRELTARRNFFINAVGKNSNLHKKRGEIILMPELCHNFMYPADLWLKALILPSILHRLHFILHGEALRKRFNKYLGVESNAGKSVNYVPKPMRIDTSLQRVVDYDGNAMEDQEEPKKKLNAIPPKECKPFSEKQLAIMEQANWKEYTEPEDYSRKTVVIYPVEIDYYYKFITGLATDLGALNLEEEEIWNSSQLKMPKVKTAAPAKTLSVAKLAIADVPLSDKKRIEILELSFDKKAILPIAEQFEFVAALTAAGANDVFDMERYELLGDSFLKFSISLFLADKYPKWHEGFLTEIKSKLVSNRNLLYCISELDIPKRICATLFKPNSFWLPPLVCLPLNVLEVLEQNLPSMSCVSPGDLYAMELSEEEVISGYCAPNQLEAFVHSCNQAQKHISDGINFNVDNDINSFVYKEVIPDKVVADTLEALLGVCVKNYGIHRSFRMLEFFGICKADVNKPLTNLLDIHLGSPLLRTNISSHEVDGFLINYQQLEENLGYKFRDRAYLLQALTHPSYPTNRLTGCYQELEFIGDAILDFLVSCYIFERNTTMTPGMLTDLRSALVNNITLGCVCVRHRFHLFILAENSVLAESIKMFADFQESQNHRVTNQVRILSEEQLQDDASFDEENTNCNMADDVDVPKALGDIVEALIAAVYLDSRDLRTTWNVIYRLLEQELTEFSRDLPIEPVRLLYEHKHADPKYSDAIVDDGKVLVQCTFTCLDKRIEVNGFGLNSKNAKRSAAKHALQILDKNYM